MLVAATTAGSSVAQVEQVYNYRLALELASYIYEQAPIDVPVIGRLANTYSYKSFVTPMHSYPGCKYS